MKWILRFPSRIAEGESDSSMRIRPIKMTSVNTEGLGKEGEGEGGGAEKERRFDSDFWCPHDDTEK